jgi:hypothetical protein
MFHLFRRPSAPANAPGFGQSAQIDDQGPASGLAQGRGALGIGGGDKGDPLPLMGQASLNARIHMFRSVFRCDRLVELLAEGDAIELVEHGLVEAHDDTIVRYEIPDATLSGWF